MIDVKALSIPELEELVRAEKAARKADAVRQIAEIAAANGFDLAELTAKPIKPANRKNYPDTFRAKGAAKEIINALIIEGKTAREIAEIAGWTGKGSKCAIYGYARRIGYRPNGTGAFVRASSHCNSQSRAVVTSPRPVSRARRLRS